MVISVMDVRHVATTRSNRSGVDQQTRNPARFFVFNSFRKSSIFSWKGLPANSIGWTLTFSRGRDGRSLPQIWSTRFCSTPTSFEPVFSNVSESFLALAMKRERKKGQSMLLICIVFRTVRTSRNDRGVNSDDFSALGLLCSPRGTWVWSLGCLYRSR